MKEYYVERAGAFLRYHDLPGGGTPLLFVHGLGCAGSFDYPQVAAQPPLQGRRRILVDLLGAGFSDRPEGFGYTVSDHAACLSELVSALGLPRFHLYGHSLGGAVALELAARLPERLAGLVLSEANLDPCGEGSASRTIADFTREEFLGGGFEALVRSSRADGNAMWAASLSRWAPDAAWGLSRSAAEGGSPAWREILYRLDRPKTFLFGERSLPAPDAAELAAHGVRVEVVPSAGHSMAWENPAGLAAAIAGAIGQSAEDHGHSI